MLTFIYELYACAAVLVYTLSSIHSVVCTQATFCMLDGVCASAVAHAYNF